MKVKAKKSISVIIVAVLAVAIGLGALSVSHNAKSMKKFVADGFILDAPAEVAVTEVNKQHYFSQGAKYQEKFDTKVLFKDANGEEVSLDINQFLHYADGSLGSFTKGVIMDLDDVGQEQFGYYSITPNTLLVKNGNDYEMSSRGEKMTISEFVWKISDTDYMIVSPEVTLQLGSSQEIVLPNYAQLKYVDSGIVRIIHQQGTYQTVSADSFLYTQGGAELNLVGKNFYQNGEPGLSLDSMAIDDDNYIELDENTDSPELKIPTFNVINGKDGVAGVAGEAGEEGEQGEDGEDGELGEEGIEGEEGMAGEEGGAGAMGNIGQDGVEGDEGIMGYDGAEGEDGENAQNGGDNGVAVDLLARPTGSVDTAENYEVTAGSAKMELKLNDPDQSWVQGETSIDIIDRNTMESIFYDPSKYATEEEAKAAAEAAAKELGRDFENANGSMMLNQSNLKPNTEYIIVVNGNYYVEKDGEDVLYGTLFSKVFKTDELGIAIAKDVVTDSSVSVKTTINASNVRSYSVRFFVIDENDTEKTIGLYNLLTGDGTYVFDNEGHPGNEGGSESADEYRALNVTVESDTTYYAEIASVVLSDGSLVDAGDTTIELKTLKKKPYSKSEGTDAEGNPVEVQTPVTEMQPNVIMNAKNRSVTVSLDKLEDEDNGIKGYRYELYRYSEYNAASIDGNLQNLTPAYSKSVTTAADQTFSIPDSESTSETFIAKVVVEFFDNEKDVDYSTLFSAPTDPIGASGSLVVEFVMNDAVLYPDKIVGQIRIKDPVGVLMPYVKNGTAPMILTIAGEYDDIKTIEIGAQYACTETDGSYIYNFEQAGLHKDAVYTLSLSGPWDTDGSQSIVSPEDMTYLAGYRTKTRKTTRMSAAFSRANDMSSATFANRVYLTNPATAGTEGNPSVTDYQYDAQIMEYLEFRLVRVLDNGVEEELGNHTVFYDSEEYQDNGNISVFYNNCWINRDQVETNAQGMGITVLENATVNSHELILTPESFGIHNQDNRLFTGDRYRIYVVVGKDYTNPHKNEIEFNAGENVVEFTINPQHLTAINPNTQVTWEPITNQGAPIDCQEAGRSADATVGIRFRAEYPYTDTEEITYYIYELQDGDTTDYSGTIFTKDDLHNSTLVLTGTQSADGSGSWRTPEVQLYFTGTKCICDAAPVTWKKPDGSDATDTTVLERGKRYFIRYEVKTNGTVDCQTDGNQDIYPNCAEDKADDATDVPFYRSSIIELKRQTPEVSRYPYVSDTNSATWRYKVVDPDNAIVGGFALRKASTVAALATASATDISSGNVDAYKNGYADLEIPSLGNNNFYAIDLKYSLMSGAAEQKISSMPVKFTQSRANANNIRVEGTDNEAAIINEGGYRYRITLQGGDIREYAAYRVTFTGEDPNGDTKSVVYDPVYPSLVAGNDVAYLYMDAAPIKELVDAGVTSVTAKVDGYFNTHISGVSGFADAAVNGTSLDMPVYALKTYQEDGTATYRKMGSRGWILAEDVTASLMIPGDGNGAGFTINDKEAVINMRYASLPLSCMDVSSLENLNEQVRINESGMKAINVSSTSYYTLEKLGVKEGITFTDSDNTIAIGSILPAVQKNKINPGATSVYMKFDTFGTGATENSKIYAMVYNKSASKLLKVDLVEETVDGETIYYYKVVDGESDYASNSFKNKAFLIKPDSTSESGTSVELRIRGLEMNTSYTVTLFAYGSNDEMIELYSIEQNHTGYPYEFKTLKAVDITVTGPSYRYVTYTDKTADFRFSIPGDEGTGKTIFYRVEDMSGNVKISEASVAPLGSGSTAYYSQDPSKNNPIKVSMAPGALAMGTQYKLIVTAKENVGGGPLGEKILTFTTPSVLQLPTFNISTLTSINPGNEENVDITAKIVSVDNNRSMKDNTYTVTLKDKNGNPIDGVQPQTVVRSAQASDPQTVTFIGVPGGAEYVIEVTANADKDNNGSGETPIIEQVNVVALGNTKATISASGNYSQYVIYFSDLQGFENVKSIVVTVYSPLDAAVIKTETIPVVEDEVAEGEIVRYIDWNVSSIGNGKYPVSVQYQDEQGGRLNTGNAYVIVTDEDLGEGAGIEGNSISGFSLRSFRPAQVSDDTLNEQEVNSPSGTTNSGTDKEEQSGNDTTGDSNVNPNNTTGDSTGESGDDNDDNDDTTDNGDSSDAGSTDAGNNGGDSSDAGTTDNGN